MKNTSLVALLLLSLLLANARLCLSQQANTSMPTQSSSGLDTHTAKMKRSVEKLGVGHQVTAVLKVGKEYHGTISKIEADSFQVAEVDLKEIVTVKYDETKKLYRDYSHKDPFFGRNPRRSTIILVSVLSLVTIGFIVGLTHISE